MSRLYYEITGRTPRKRKNPSVISNTNHSKIRRPQLYPQSLSVWNGYGMVKNRLLWLEILRLPI